MKIETGVMVIKDKKAWGKIYQDGRVVTEGWTALEDGTIKDAQFYHKPEDFIYSGDPRVEEIKKGKVVVVRRKTNVDVL